VEPIVFGLFPSLADVDGLEVYLDNTAWAKRIYEKEKAKIEMPGGDYIVSLMVRPARSKDAM
jgi:hypothetical protein